jgi:hypothetical protein
MAKKNIPYLNDEGQYVRCCSKCGTELPSTLDFFRPRKNGYDGLSSECRDCRKKYLSQYKEGLVHVAPEKQICLKCKNEHPTTKQYFHVDKSRKSGFQPICKECAKIKIRKWYSKPESRILVKENGKAYYEKNRDKILAECAEYRVQPHVKEQRNRRQRRLRRTDPKFRLSSSIGTLMRRSLTNGYKHSHWENLVDYTVDDLKRHIERKFKDGMTWEKLLNGEIHIDHKIPISAFNYKSPDDIDFRKCWALENLQPMWAKENIRKGNKLEKPFQPSLAFGGSIN